MKRLVLASGSPRRQEILSQLGLEFDVMISRANEALPEGLPAGKGCHGIGPAENKGCDDAYRVSGRYHRG